MLERRKDVERSLKPSEIKKLSVAERMLIVEEIWDSIAADQSLMEVTEAQKKELDRRIALHDAAPNQGKSWEETRDRLKAAK
jgi:putative addiction module component (TIGR02574 family)